LAVFEQYKNCASTELEQNNRVDFFTYSNNWGNFGKTYIMTRIYYLIMKNAQFASFHRNVLFHIIRVYSISAQTDVLLKVCWWWRW